MQGLTRRTLDAVEGIDGTRARSRCGHLVSTNSRALQARVSHSRQRLEATPQQGLMILKNFERSRSVVSVTRRRVHGKRIISVTNTKIEQLLSFKQPDKPVDPVTAHLAHICKHSQTAPPWSTTHTPQELQASLTACHFGTNSANRKGSQVFHRPPF